MGFGTSLLPLADLGEVVPIVTVFLIFGGGGVLTNLWVSWNKTRIELARLRAEQHNSVGVNNREVAALHEELAALRAEVSSLRDTATQYDISFDTALQRMDSRMTHLERRTASPATISSATTPTEETQQITLR